MKRHVAEQAIAALFDAAAKTNDTLLLIQKECTEEEFVANRHGTGLAMGYLYSGVVATVAAALDALEATSFDVILVRDAPYEEAT